MSFTGSTGSPRLTLNYPAIPRLAGHIQSVYDECIPAYPLAHGLWDVCSGLEVKGGESFNFQFPRGASTSAPQPTADSLAQARQPVQVQTSLSRLMTPSDSVPCWGVSNEGECGREQSLRAAYASAKARAYGPSADAMCVGIIMDGERITSGGRGPYWSGTNTNSLCRSPSAGPFAPPTLAFGSMRGSTFRCPSFRSPMPRSTKLHGWKQVCKRFDPFIHTPDGTPRRLTVPLVVSGFGGQSCAARTVGVEVGSRSGSGGASGHVTCIRLSFLLVFRD